MPTYKVVDIVDGQPTFEVPLKEILASLKKGDALKKLTALEFYTQQQVNWFKGVLLPALSNDSGDSKRWWEVHLIESIFPEDVEYVTHNNRTFPIAKSISSYSKKKMSQLIEESVPLLHTWGHTWVTYPDPELRR